MWSRPVDDVMEKFFYLISKEGIYNFAWVHNIVSSTPLSLELVNTAVDQVASNHPLLRSLPRMVESKLNWVEIPDAVVPVEEINGRHWLDVLHTTLDEPFDFDLKPLWRVRIINDKNNNASTDPDYPYKCQLYFSYSHAILDSSTVMLIFKEFMSILDNLMNSETASDTSSVQSEDLAATQLIPSIRRKWYNDLVDIIISLPIIRNLMRKVCIGMSGNNAWVSKYGSSLSEDGELTGSISSRIIPKQLSKEETTKLIQRAKSHDVTVNNILETICCISMAQLFCEGDIKTDQDVFYSYDVSLRRYMDKQYDTDRMIGPYVTSVETKTNIPQDWKNRFWEIVKNRSGNIKKQLATRKAFKTISEVRIVNTVIESCWPVTDFDPTSRFNYLFNIGNLGNWNNLNESITNIKVKDGFNNVDESKFGQVFSFYFLTVAERLSISLTYHKQYANQDLIEKLWASMYKILEDEIFSVLK